MCSCGKEMLEKLISTGNFKLVNWSNIGVLLEVGRVPLTLYARKLAIKNWERIRKNKANSLIIESYKESLKEKLPWVIYRSVVDLDWKYYTQFFYKNIVSK